MLQQQKGNPLQPGKDLNTPKEEVTLTNCDREPIHIPGSIQPHGYLIGITESGEIQHLSENIIQLVGQEVGQWLGKPLTELIGSCAALQLNQRVSKLSPKRFITTAVEINSNGKSVRFDARLHRQGGLTLIDLEQGSEQSSSFRELELYNNSLQCLQESQSVSELAQTLAEEIQQLIEFDRVMVYRFKEDFSGEVIAEAKVPLSDSFLGLHLPAADIPLQARLLYQQNPVRIIPNVSYEPVPIHPEINQLSGQPLDLSFSALRSVSPIHIQYLKNMQVRASMSVSIMKNGKLWGLIACHHQQPQQLSYQKRQLCELLGKAFSMIFNEKEALVLKNYQQQLQETKKRLFHAISTAAKFTDGLYKQEPNVKDLIPCGGCVTSFGGNFKCFGETPGQEQLKALVGWLQKEVDEEVFFTNKLPDIYEPAGQFLQTGSGLLAIAVSKVQQEYILWFRPELVHTVRWAGKKEKWAGQNELLSPRQSFKAWAEQVGGEAEPWHPLEVEAARELRGVLIDAVLRMAGELKLRADIISRINRELDTSKNELDSFAYIVSHDLKEPLRGITNYASFLLEDYKDSLDSDGQAKLHTLMRLSTRMQQLIDSLLHFSRLGRMEINPQDVDMGTVLSGVVDIFGQQLSNEKVQIQQPGNWPTLSCDELRVSEVWMNLLSNALKYNEKAIKKLQLGYRKVMPGEVSPSGYVFYVADNGIGVDPRHHEDVFNIFRRLHDRDAYGGGTGAGLTIVKKIVERHGGAVWLESRLGKGTTFFFSL